MGEGNIEQMLKDMLTKLGKTVSEEQFAGLVEHYKDNPDMIINDYSTKTGKKIDLKTRVGLKRNYQVPLSFKETLALGESEFNPNADNPDSTAYGHYQIVESQHKDRVKQLYGADWQSFKKDTDLQEKYMDVLEADYDRALPKFKNYQYAKDQKFTDEQIKAGIHYFGMGDAQSFFQSGKLSPNKADRIPGFQQLSNTFLDERKNYGAPKSVASQYGLLPEQQQAEAFGKTFDISEIVKTNNERIAEGKKTTEQLSQPTKIYNTATEGQSVIQNTEKLFRDVNNKEKEAGGGMLSAVGNFLYEGALKTIGMAGVALAAERKADRDLTTKRKLDEIKKEKGVLFDNLKAPITPVSTDDVFDEEIHTPQISNIMGSIQPVVSAQSTEDAHNSTIKRVNDHTELMRQSVDHYKSKLTVQEQQIANNLDKLTPDFFTTNPPSPEMERFLQSQENFNQQLRLNDENVSKYTPLVEQSMKAILNARQNGEDPKLAFNTVVGKFTADNPKDVAAIDKIKESVNKFIDTSEPAVGVPVAEWLQETAYKVGGSLSAMGEGIAEPFKKFFRNASPDKRFSAAEFDGLSAEDAKRKIMDIVATNPNDASTSDLAENTVKVGNRIVVLKDGKPDHLKDATTGKVIYYQTKQDDQLLLDFAQDPEEYIKKNNLKKETDFRFDVLWNQGGQIVSDMIPMIATGGSTAGIVGGSMLVSYGDYYEEARAQGKNVTDASFYAGLTSGLIGVVEAKVGKAEKLLGRALSGAEKNAFYKAAEAFSSKTATRGALKATLERGYLQKFKEFIKAGYPIISELPSEVIEEMTNFPVEASTQAAMGLDVKAPSSSEVVNTIGLTVFATTAMGLIGGGASVNKQNITDLVGLAVNNREGFKEISANWIQAAKDKDLGAAEIKRREDEVARKSKIIATVGEYYDYIKEESEGRKMKDEKKSEIMDLAEQKAMVDYEIDKATSQIRKDKLALKSQEIQKELDKLVYDGTDIATEEETAETTTTTKPKENAVQEQKTTEVPVQPKTESSGTDTQGQSQPKPEGTTQQGKTQEQAQGEEVKQPVESFETAKGSVYTVLPDGKTQRFKTATGEKNDPQDLIVFAKFKDAQQEQDFLSAQNRKNGQKLVVVDKDGTIYNTNEEIKGKDVKLAIIKDGNIIETAEISIDPKIGYNTFDQRRFEKDGEPVRSTHLGNKVTKINYKPTEPVQSTISNQQGVPTTQGENVAPTQPKVAQNANVLADFEVTTTKGTAAPRTYTKNSNGKWIAQTKKEDGTLSKGVPVSSANVVAQLDSESSKRAAESTAPTQETTTEPTQKALESLVADPSTAADMSDDMTAAVLDWMKGLKIDIPGLKIKC